MAIRLPNGFKIGSIEPIDTRLVLSKTEMLNMNDNIMPANYVCVCKDDGKIYIYDKEETTPSTETGKFHLADVDVESIPEETIRDICK